MFDTDLVEWIDPLRPTAGPLFGLAIRAWLSNGSGVPTDKSGLGSKVPRLYV
jgi:hypothetical protein